LLMKIFEGNKNTAKLSYNDYFPWCWIETLTIQKLSILVLIKTSLLK
jgi:hypothetical protein